MPLFHEIEPAGLTENVFSMIGTRWMLVTAGSPEQCNTMTASWGGLGVLWSRPVAFCFIRPQRYTYKFIERSEGFTLSFFDERYRGALNLCGSKSGRDIDKIKAAGLTPACDGQRVFFEEADTVLLCKKLYFDDFKPDHFLDPSLFNNYAQNDFHRIYIGGIEKVLSK